ncbi:MAG: transposase [Moorea sp. SIO4A5]|nr:transposase [Moorena sp. SIO4A5]
MDLVLINCSARSDQNSILDAVAHGGNPHERLHQDKVFKGLSVWGKNSIGWYYGFKLHLIINDQGELLAFQLTPANVDDRVPVPSLAQNLQGRLFGDKGYISNKLFKELSLHSLKLITPFKKNMKNQLVELW